MTLIAKSYMGAAPTFSVTLIAICYAHCEWVLTLESVFCVDQVSNILFMMCGPNSIGPIIVKVLIYYILLVIVWPQQVINTIRNILNWYSTWVWSGFHANRSCMTRWCACRTSSLVLYCMALTGVGPCRYRSILVNRNDGPLEAVLCSSLVKSSYSIFSLIFAWN